MEGLSLSKYFKLLLKNWKIITYFTAGMVTLAVIAGVTIYKPAYESKAKIMVKESTPSKYIVPLGEGNEMTSSSPKSPILNQIEIFSSKAVAAGAWERIKSDPFLGQYPERQMVSALRASLDLKNTTGTDVIEVSFKWSKPDEAQKIAQAYIESFINHNIELNRESVSQKKNYIQKQLDDSQKELNDLRSKIKNYKESNRSLNIDKEAVNVIERISFSENELADINKQLNAEKSRNKELSAKLGLNYEKAINSIALGQNSNLQSLQRDLQSAQQKLAEANIKYTSMNPMIKMLEENIKEIKSQIQSQVKLTIGKELTDTDNSNITDPVRTQIVGSLISSQANIQALKAQKFTLVNTLNGLKSKQLNIPEVQKNIQSMHQNESTLAAVVETLNTKLIEAKIRESEIVSDLSLIDPPSLPVSASFPTMLHLILFFGIAGVMLGIATILGINYVRDTAQGSHEIESIIKAPVFGVIPWLNSTTYSKTSMKYNPESIVSIIYQKILTTLKIRCFKKEVNVIGISSAEFEKNRSFVCANLAKSFEKAGNSILIIDADFRNGCIAKEFGINTEERKDLADAVVQVASLKDGYGDQELASAVSSAMIAVPEHKNLFIIPNNSKGQNAYELINTKALPELIGYLRSKFDYIIVDTPPILAVPDTVTLSQYIDGLVLLCGIKTSRSNLTRINKICEENYVDILGVIARDSLTELELPENQYIKQLSA